MMDRRETFDQFCPMPLTRKAFPWEIKSVDEDERTVEAIVSTESKDRMGDIIRQAGWDLKMYMKNPVVLWGHDYGQPPIGNAIDMAVVMPKSSKGVPFLRSVTRFAETDFAEEVLQLYRQEVLRAFSVGFIPKVFERMYEGEGDDKKFVGFEFKEQELLEYSSVPVPANQEALALGMQKGLIQRTLASFVYSVPEMCGKVKSVASRSQTPEAGRGSGQADTVNHIVQADSMERLNESLENLSDLLG